MFGPIAQLAATGRAGTNQSLTAERGADAIDARVCTGPFWGAYELRIEFWGLGTSKIVIYDQNYV